MREREKSLIGRANDGVIKNKKRCKVEPQKKTAAEGLKGLGNSQKARNLEAAGEHFYKNGTLCLCLPK